MIDDHFDSSGSHPRRILVDLEAGTVAVEGPNGTEHHQLGTDQGFRAVSHAWLRAGWDAKHVYSFTWLGRPIIQLPEDVVRLQELVWNVQPDVVVETGVAHGGSLVLWASLCHAAGRGRVIGVDIEIRPHNRQAIEAHPLTRLITLIEGDSTDPATATRVRELVSDADTVFVVLDSNHTKAHVAAELDAYAPLVSPGSYLAVMDGIMGELSGAPRSREDWKWDNPREAAREFAARSRDFELIEPPFIFNEGAVTERVTYAPGGILRRIDPGDQPAKSG